MQNFYRMGAVTENDLVAKVMIHMDILVQELIHPTVMMEVGPQKLNLYATDTTAKFLVQILANAKET